MQVYSIFYLRFNVGSSYDFPNVFMSKVALSSLESCLRKLVVLSFSIVCGIAIAVGFLCWLPAVLAEKKLQSYVERLEKRGYCVEERPMSHVQVDDSMIMLYYSDLTYAANWESVDQIYFDRKTQAIYFLIPRHDKLGAYIFYYMLARDE